MDEVKKWMKNKKEKNGYKQKEKTKKWKIITKKKHEKRKKMYKWKNNKNATDETVKMCVVLK
jgi:hypothetical protein